MFRSNSASPWYIISSSQIPHNTENVNTEACGGVHTVLTSYFFPFVPRRFTEINVKFNSNFEPTLIIEKKNSMKGRV